ncbi:outer membrane beta-barrel protein [Capnocytophaga canis]|uniref:outer membrane beta-barrel protein n=1 Tax=Capnocytophaga canis TaxID=1848903 RepID=UPI001561EC3E|nr:outer membrane beta-barrel protein [Capnocytophaga canis]
MKRLIGICFFLLSIGMSAQQFTIVGEIYDKETQKPVEAATVFVRTVKDSILVNYTISDAKGKFTLKGKSSDDFLNLIISHVGNATFKKRIETPKPRLDLGKIELEAKAFELESVTVTSEAIPITVKKDTLEFNADAFKLRPDATVEELLKNLPGVEVDASGNITVNGVAVNELLVNGKPFFNDVKTATRNLTKDIVKKIQVSDTKTKEQKFTRQESTSDNKSINIVLKEDKNKGVFGRVTAGYGTKDRYEFSGIGNYFKDKTRVSVLASSNNINSAGFEFDEIYGMMSRGFRGTRTISMSGSSFSINGVSFGGSSEGLNVSHSAGMNYADTYAKNMEVDANYLFTHSDNENHTKSLRETTLPNRHYFSDREHWGNSWNDNHSVRASLEYKLDSLTQIEVSPNLGINNAHSSSRSMEQSLNSNRTLVNSSESTNQAQTNNVNFNNYVSLRRRFKGRGFWGIGFENSNSRSERFQQIDNRTEVFGANPSVQVRDQQQEANNTSDQYRLRTSFRYPIAKTFFVRGEYVFSKTNIKNDVDTYDANLSGNYVNFNTALSSDFITQNTQQRPSVGLEWNKDKVRWSGGVSLVSNRIENQDFLRDLDLDRTFTNFSVETSLRYEFQRGKNMSVRYDSSTQVPSVNQLQPIDNVNNPLHTFTGNPDLRPTFEHSIRADFSNFNWETRTGYFLWFNAYLSEDKITSITLTNDDLTRRTTYTNIDGDYSLMFGIDYNKSNKWDKNKLKYGLGTFSSIRENNQFSNGTRYALTNYSLSLRSSLGYDYDEKINIELTYNPVFNMARYNSDIFENQNYTQHRTGLRITSYVPKNMVIGSDFSYSYLPYMSEGFRKGYFYWNASVGYKFLEDKAIIQLKAFDILNQTVDSSRIITQDYVQDSQRLMLKQYFMLTFTYKLNKVGGNKGSKVKFMWF